MQRCTQTGGGILPRGGGSSRQEAVVFQELEESHLGKEDKEDNVEEGRGDKEQGGAIKLFYSYVK
jgi:hypothetical protein